jgi:hypothetical protein
MKKLIFIIVVLSVIFASCEKEAFVTDESIESVSILIPSTAKLITEKSIISYTEGEVTDAANYAQLLAKAIADKSVRSFIKDESNKKFDGDYNFLVNKAMDAKVGTSTFKEKISRFNKNNNLKSATIFESVLENDKLHVSVPVLIDEWDVSKHELLVAVAVDVVDGETEYVYAYDSKGRAYMLDANVEPDVPVIVIANNERLGMDFESYSNEKSSRISGRWEKVTYIKCPGDLNIIESWLKGGPEIRFHAVVYTDGATAATMLAGMKQVNLTREEARAGIQINQPLFRWCFDSNHGPDYYIQSSEIDDAGTTYTLSVGVTVGKKDAVSGSAEFEITFKSLDKTLAGELIHYTSSAPSRIFDSRIDFTIRNEN